MKKWQIAVSILLVFALGTAAGAFGSRIIFKNRVNRALHTEGTPGIKVIQKMVNKLDLSESQRASITAILDSNNKKWETIRQEYEPKIKTLFETVIEETKKELTAQQRQEIEQMSANVQRRLPSRSSSRQRVTSPPSSSSPPATTSRPQSPEPFGPKSQRMSSEWIVEKLHLDKEKSSEIQSIVREALESKASRMEQFAASQETAEKAFREKMSDEQQRTEKKLQPLLTPDQMETYIRLTSRDNSRPDGFELDTPLDAMDRKGP